MAFWHQHLSMVASSSFNLYGRKANMNKDSFWKRYLHTAHNLIDRYNINETAVPHIIYILQLKVKRGEYTSSPVPHIISIDISDEYDGFETVHIVVDDNMILKTAITNQHYWRLIDEYRKERTDTR